MLNRVANRHEEFEPLTSAQVGLVAILRDRDTLHQFHHEIRTPRLRRTRVENFGDVRVIHHRQRLAFRLEPGDHLLGIHPRLDDFQRHLATNGLALLRHVDGAHAPFADRLKKFVRADDCSRELLHRGSFHRHGRDLGR